MTLSKADDVAKHWNSGTAVFVLRHKNKGTTSNSLNNFNSCFLQYRDTVKYRIVGRVHLIQRERGGGGDRKTMSRNKSPVFSILQKRETA